MARGWLSLVLIVSGLSVCGSAVAQPPAPVAGTMPMMVPGGMMPYAPPPSHAPEPACPPDEAGCDPGTNISIALDYLLWFHKRPNIPPLATLGSFRDPIPGAIGQRNTVIALANGDGEEQRSGFRVRLGYNFDPENLWAVDGSFFILEAGNNINRLASSGAVGSQVLARPFYNINIRAEDADPVAVPGVMSGTLTVDQPSRLYGADANLRLNYALSRSTEARLTFLAGFRWLWLDDQLGITQDSQDLPGLGAAGNRYILAERFVTSNNFYGGQLGMEAEQRVGRMTFRALGKVALGQTYQEAKLNSTIRIVEGNGAVALGNNHGLLVQPSNAGATSRERFSVVPEGQADVGFEFNEHVRVIVGYQFLFWNRVTRPGGVIDRSINVQALQPFDQIGIARPAPVFNTEGFWVHGLYIRAEVVF